MSSDKEQSDNPIGLDDVDLVIVSSFEIKLQEMEKKLPPKLGELDTGTNYPDYIQDKEFCYKFLYCWLNNPDNQKNEDVKAVYNSIIDAYDIQNIEKQATNSIILNNKITFDVGFIINIEPTKGGTTTQKRRPNKSKKRNRTIKDMVRVNTR